MKYNMYLEFLLKSPSRSALDNYEAGLTPENKEQIDSLLLFSFFEMQQLAKERKLIGIGDMFFTISGLVVILLSVLTTSILNRSLFHFSIYGFIILFGVFVLAGWSYLIFYRKHYFYVNGSTLWKIVLEQNLEWINRDPDNFKSTLDDYSDSLPEDKSQKILNKVRRQISR